MFVVLALAGIARCFPAKAGTTNTLDPFIEQTEGIRLRKLAVA